MIKNDLSKIIINLPETFTKILKKIDENRLGILFVVNKDLKLIGSISDGDIRRDFLKKINHQIIILFMIK